MSRIMANMTPKLQIWDDVYPEDIKDEIGKLEELQCHRERVSDAQKEEIRIKQKHFFTRPLGKKHKSYK